MTDFFFYTDYESFISQDAGDRFGPISDSNYRVDSKTNVAASSKAYAVCDGLVFVQRSTSGNLNIILKPLVQPGFNIGKISYYIYREILPSSLISGQNVATRTSNALTEKVWYNQEKTDANSETGPNTPSIDALGISYSATGTGNLLVPDTHTIESVFLKADENQLPLIKAGDHIGNFVGGATKCGFEIIVERVGKDPKMAIGRSAEHIVTISQPLGTTDYQKFLHYHLKEEILQFLDPAPFFGMFSGIENGLKIKSTTGAAPTLSNLISKFQNKNRIYLDIRSEYDYSYNYYYQFGTNLGCSSNATHTVATIPEYNYYTQNMTSGSGYGTWPIFIVDNLTVNALTGNDQHGSLFLKLPNANATLKCVYFSEGKKRGKTRENKFEFPQNNALLELSSWIYDSGSNQPVFGSAYVLMKLVYDRSSSYTGLFKPSSSTISHKFAVNRLKADLEMGPEDVAIRSYYNGTVVERIEYPEYAGDIYAAQLGIAKDSHSYAFFTSPNNDIGYLSNESTRPNFTFLTMVHKNKTDFMSTLYSLAQNIDIEVNNIGDEILPVETIRLLKRGDDALSNTLEPALFDTVQITHEQYDDLLSLASTSGFITDFDIYLSTKKEETTGTEIAGFHVSNILLTLEGLEFVPDTGSTQIRKKTVDTTINLNSIITKDL